MDSIFARVGMLAVTIFLMLVYMIIDILLSRKVVLIKNICMGMVYFLLCFSIVSGSLFGLNAYSMPRSYVILLIIALAAIAILYFLNYGSRQKMKEIERIAYFPKALFVLMVIGCILTANKFDFFGMGQDQGVYQTKALLLMAGHNDNQYDLRAYNALESENDKNDFIKFSKGKGAVGNIKGFYIFADNSNRGTVSPTEQNSPVSGFFHGAQVFPALLSISGKIFGIGGIMYIQTLLYLLALVLIWLIMDVNLALNKLTSIVITGLYIISPVILWVSKSALTEMFLCLCVLSFLFFITSDETSDQKMLWLPIAAYSFFHPTIYTLMPLFGLLFIGFFNQKKKRLDLLVSAIVSVVSYTCGFLAMSYSSPQYTFDVYGVGLKPFLSLVGVSHPYFGLSGVVLAVSFTAILILSAAWFICSKVEIKINSKLLLSFIKITVILCMIVIAIKWFAMSFVAPSASDRWKSYKDHGLMASVFHLCFVAYMVASCFVILIPLTIGFIRKNNVFIAEKIFPITVMCLYTVFIYSAFMRVEIPYYYYYSRYLAPFVPIVLILGGICVNGFCKKTIAAIALFGMLPALWFSSAFLFSGGDGSIDFKTLEKIIARVNSLDDDAVVNLSAPLIQQLYFPLDGLTTKTILPEIRKNNSYIISNESISNANIFTTGYHIFSRGSTGKNSLPSPFDFIKYKYNIYFAFSPQGIPEYNLGDMPLHRFSSQNNDNVLNRDFFVSNGKSGALMYGPYMRLSKGEYLFEIDCELISANGASVGRADVCASQGKKIIAEAPINQAMFSENKLTLEIPFAVSEDLKDFELRVFVEEGAILKIAEVRGKKENL
jgi:hypothetical protein